MSNSGYRIKFFMHRAKMLAELLPSLDVALERGTLKNYEKEQVVRLLQDIQADCSDMLKEIDPNFNYEK